LGDDALDRTLISWNVPNIVTVWLMAAVGFLAFGLVWQLVRQNTGGGSGN